MSSRNRQRVRSGRTPPRSPVRWILVIAASVAGVALLGYVLADRSPMALPAQSVPLRRSPGPTETVRNTGEVRFLRPDGQTKARVVVEIVDDESSRSLGLMYRRSMGADYGMLFVFDSAAIQSFWMKNTILPLDMIFVNERGRVVTIHADTRPYTLQTYSSAEPALYVVEVNAGFSKTHGLIIGDQMEWNRRGEEGVHH
jgi:uncharacterized protein